MRAHTCQGMHVVCGCLQRHEEVVGSLLNKSSCNCKPLKWVLGTKLRSSVRTRRALHLQVVSISSPVATMIFIFMYLLVLLFLGLS